MPTFHVIFRWDQLTSFSQMLTRGELRGETSGPRSCQVYFSSVPSQPDKPVPYSLITEFTQRKGFAVVVVLCCLFPFTSCKDQWEVITEKNTWEDMRLCTIISPQSRQPSRSRTSTNLGLPASSPSPQSDMQEADLASIMWTTSSHGLWELSDHICWTPRPKTPNSTGMLFALPFWSSVDWFSCSG